MFSALKMYVTVLTFQIRSTMWWSGQTDSKAWLCRRCTIVFCHDWRDMWLDQTCTCRDRTWASVTVWKKNSAKRYANISREALQFYQMQCMQCQKKKKRGRVKGIVVKAILSKNPPLSGSDRFDRHAINGKMTVQVDQLYNWLDYWNKICSVHEEFQPPHRHWNVTIQSDVWGGV